MARYTDIAPLVYANLRAIHESRARRIDVDAHIPHLSDPQIFMMMPDHRELNWTREAQEGIMEATLATMATTVQFPHPASRS